MSSNSTLVSAWSLRAIAEVVEDDEVEPIEPGDRGLEREVATGSLEPLDEVNGAGEQDPVAVLDQGVAKGPGAVTLPATRWAEDQQIGTFLEPGVAGGEGIEVRLAEHRHDGEVEAVESLARRQVSFGEVALDAPRARSASSSSARRPAAWQRASPRDRHDR